jgi:SPP1 gp7 family putative phage head morphogenesis protein
MAIDPKKQLPNPTMSSNDEFFDAMVRHQIFLLRMSGKLRNDMVALLDATEKDISRAIRNSGIKGDAFIDFIRLKRLQKNIKKIRQPAWNEVAALLQKEMEELALAEPDFVAAVTKTVVPVVIDLETPDVRRLKAIVKAKPFEGRTLEEWSAKMNADDLARIDTEIKIGMVQGEDSAKIARRVVGTVSLKGKDGVTQITRNQAATISRTATNHIANQSRKEMFEENKDVFSKEQYVATLDSRTTPICRSLDGKIFPVGEGAIPPLHFACRSLRIAVIDGNKIKNRPAKSSTTRQLLDDFARDQGIKKVSKRANLPRGFKGKYDKFARNQIRKMTGTVPGKLTYGEWLSRQSNSFQDDVLGKTKGKLFRKGNLTLDRFVNRRGDELNLSEIASRDRKAFIDAGLDPEDFL